MQEAQFVFVTVDARVMARLVDGRLQDVTETCDLLPARDSQSCADVVREKKRALLLKFAA